MSRPSDPLGLESGQVRLLEYDTRWPGLFEAEARRLKESGGPLPLALEHVGSTAVPGICAKPVLDILAGRAPGVPVTDYVARIQEAGYEHRGDRGIAGHEFFRRGQPRAYQVHLVEQGGALWHAYLAFRDYLRAHAEVARGYADLKRALARRFPQDREAYINGKASFVQEILRLSARALLLLTFATGGCAPKEEQGAIGVQNAAGRSGAYYIPAGSRHAAIPLLIVLHSTGASGEGVLDWFRALARERRFAIIAPESHLAPDGQITWSPGDAPGMVTADLEHVLRAVQWVIDETGLTVDTAHVLIAGHSGGGSSAPYIASNRPGFTHIAILHGGVFPGGIGPRRMSVWFSTGDRDRLRPPALVRQAADALERMGFPVTFQVFPGTHGASDAELQAVIQWWLGS